MQTTTTKIAAGDIDISCAVLGDGPPLVAVHGAIGLGSAYMRALDPWADDVRLVHYDQRGSGETPVGDVRRVSFTGGLEDLDGLRRGLGLEEVGLLGHSAGAYLAALYAAEHPEATTALVLLNPGPPLAPDLMQQFGAAMTARRTPADDQARREIEESPAYLGREPGALERHQLNTFAPFFRDHAAIDRVDLGFTEITAANVQQAPERMMGSLAPLDPMARFADIACPTLVVHSERDPIPLAWSQVLAGAIPGAELAVLEGASHFPMVEDIDRLRGTVLPWLTGRLARADRHAP